MSAPSPSANLGGLLQDFFANRMVQQKNASSQTVASYRDSFRLLLQFAQKRLGKRPECLSLADLDAPLMLSFLNYLEVDRHNAIRTRNTRLAAVRSFLHFAAWKEPACLPGIQRVLAIPLKRFDRPLLGFLAESEMQALLNAADETSWCGLRDRVLLATLYNTGARVSEIIGVSVSDLVLHGSPTLRLHGKGRKDRAVPLWRSTAAQIRRWLPQIDSQPDKPLFPSCSGIRMTRSAVTQRLQLAVQAATTACPQLAKRQISPHTVRHTTAMHMLQSGVDITVIALWLGHGNPSTTHMYIEADLAMKERALKSVRPPSIRKSRYRPPDPLLRFLQTL